MTEKRKYNKTYKKRGDTPEEIAEYMKLYRREWERKNRSCAARGVKHSGKGLPACYLDIEKSKPQGLVIKRAPKDNLFKVTFD
jgi:hypothetical protein